jgi:hypothetical protein
MSSLFDGMMEEGMAPQRTTIHDIYHATSTQATWLASGGDSTVMTQQIHPS